MREQICVRDATEADVPEIREIYNEAILNTTATFDIEPRSMEDRLAWFRETRFQHAVIVAEEVGNVVAWGTLRPYHARAAYRFTAEDSVYVHHDRRGQGVGSVILARLIEIALERAFHSVMAGVSEGNPASERLHASFGFTPIGTEREVGYKFERWLDVGWWQLMLGTLPRSAPKNEQ